MLIIMTGKRVYIYERILYKERNKQIEYMTNCNNSYKRVVVGIQLFLVQLLFLKFEWKMT